MGILAAAAKQQVAKEDAARQQRDRSPSFPFIPLKTAIERLVAFEEHHKRSSVAPDRIGPAWAMKPNSSQAQQTLAALRAFGLLETSRSEGGRTVSLSEEGRTYLRAQQENIKQAVLQRAALRPKQIETHWRDWGNDRPADAACLDDLVLKEGFSDDGAKIFLRVYDATIAYAGLAGADKIGPVLETEIGDEEGPRSKIEVGDLVNVERNGALVFPTPVRVRAVEDHDEQLWVWTDGSDSWTEMETVQLVSKGTDPSDGGRIPPPPPNLQEEIAVMTSSAIGKATRLDREREWLRGPLSKETSYRLIVTGEPGPKEIGKLIKLLKAQQLVLSDDDEEEEE